jgi:cell division septum initiation protein DivIVA
MPDQSEASSEHALIQEITMPLATLPDDPVKVASDVDFPVVLRGYDRLAVDAYVKKTSQVVAELQATRSPEAAVRRALDRVGEEVSGILQRAHETAAQITAKSRSEAEDRLEAARQEALQITAAAEQRVKDLDAETDRIWAERQRIVDDTRELARQLFGLADSAAERFPADEEPESSRPADGEPGRAADEEPEPPPQPDLSEAEARSEEQAADPFPTPVSGDPRASRAQIEPQPSAESTDDTFERDRTSILPPDKDR